MIGLAIMGMSSAIAVPPFVSFRNYTRLNVCTNDRRTFERADSNYALQNSSYAASIDALFGAGYVKKAPACPSGGSWSWNDGTNHDKIVCSFHNGVSIASGDKTINATSAILSGRWFKNSDSIWTNWGGQTATFKIRIEEKGDYSIELFAKNHAGPEGWTQVDGYEHFHIKVKVDGKTVPSLDVPVSDREYKSDQTFINALKPGEHTLTFVWENDAYKSKKLQDNNIEIKEISIRKKEK